MAVFAAISFATFFLENDHFLALYKGSEHFTFNFSAFNGRRTDFDVAVGIEKKHFVESDSVALFHFVAEMMDIQELALFGLELLSFDFYDSVHLNY